MTDSFDVLALVADIESSSGYYWDVTAVFYDKVHNAYRIASDSGCSCDWAWNTFDAVDDFGPPMGTAEVVKKWREEFTHPGDLDDREEAVRIILEHSKRVGARK